MALISGRPISFKMDLYNPLYVDRPVVEPELFASLRPVTYRGAFDNRQGQFMIGGSVNVLPVPGMGPPGAVAATGMGQGALGGALGGSLGGGNAGALGGAIGGALG